MTHDNLPTGEVLVWPPPGPFAPRKIIVRPGHLRDKPDRTGWECWEDPQVCPLFETRHQALDYGIWRGNNGSSTLEVHDAAGKVLRSISGEALVKLANERALAAHQKFDAMNTMSQPRGPDAR